VAAGQVDLVPFLPTLQHGDFAVIDYNLLLANGIMTEILEDHLRAWHDLLRHVLRRVTPFST
jgi:hypothetical protein